MMLFRVWHIVLSFIFLMLQELNCQDVREGESAMYVVGSLQ